MSRMQRILTGLGLLAVAAVVHLWYCKWHVDLGQPKDVGSVLFTFWEEVRDGRSPLADRTWSVQLWTRAASVDTDRERAFWLGVVLPISLLFLAFVVQFRSHRPQRLLVAAHDDRDSVVLVDSDEGLQPN